MVQGGISTVKFLLFLFNFIFAVSNDLFCIATLWRQVSRSYLLAAHLSCCNRHSPLCGIAFVAIGVTAKTSGKFIVPFLGNRYITAINIFFLLGCVIFLIALWGCYAVIRQSNSMVRIFAVLLFLTFIAEISCGFVAYFLTSDIDNFLHKEMMAAFDQNATDTRIIFNEMQSGFPCCGVNGPEDYTMRGLTYPHTCCGKAVTTKCMVPSETVIGIVFAFYLAISDSMYEKIINYKEGIDRGSSIYLYENMALVSEMKQSTESFGTFLKVEEEKDALNLKI